MHWARLLASRIIILGSKQFLLILYAQAKVKHIQACHAFIQSRSILSRINPWGFIIFINTGDSIMKMIEIPQTYPRLLALNPIPCRPQGRPRGATNNIAASKVSASQTPHPTQTENQSTQRELFQHNYALAEEDLSSRSLDFSKVDSAIDEIRAGCCCETHEVLRRV